LFGWSEDCKYGLVSTIVDRYVSAWHERTPCSPKTKWSTFMTIKPLSETIDPESCARLERAHLDDGLIRKATEQFYHDTAAYAAATGSPIPKPASYSGVYVIEGGETYVVLENIHGTMAVYKVSEPVTAESTVTRVDRDNWPSEFEDQEDEEEDAA
jgi:hypothetical protein